MKRNWFLWILLILFLCTFLISAFVLGKYYYGAFLQRKQASELSDMVQQAKDDPEKDYTIPLDSLDPTEPVVQEALKKNLILIMDPDTGKRIPILPEYAPIYLANTDTVGWIKIEGTDIDYPVMQTPESPNYYLNHSFKKEYHNHGCIYVQELCDVNEPSDNVTIYGHRMRSGVMFYDLQNYKKESYFQAHPIIQFDTLTEHHEYQILAVFLTTASQGEGFRYHEFINAANNKEFSKYIRTCKELALYDTGITAGYGDKLITLSTCEYSQPNGRLVVVAKRIT